MIRWDAPQEPFDPRAFERLVRRQLRERPRSPMTLVSSSFYFAWLRRWKAHWLSLALGYPSKEPPIR